jgi:hypothetical protein
MVGSKARKDILVLGQQIVKDLRLEPGVDTLGRWMAHHLAELIIAADRASSPRERTTAKKEAVDLIVRIWDHRANIERINPMADLRSILDVLGNLAQKHAPFADLLGTESSIADAARRAYDLLRRVTICLSLLAAGGVDASSRGLRRARRTANHQTIQERELVARLSVWIEPTTLVTGKEMRRARNAGKSRAQEAETLDLPAIARNLLQEAQSTLAQLSAQLENWKPQIE